jgi:hypothetical protein
LLYRREREKDTVSGPRSLSSMNSRKGHIIVYLIFPSPYSEKVYGKLTAERI